MAYEPDLFPRAIKQTEAAPESTDPETAAAVFGDRPDVLVGEVAATLRVAAEMDEAAAGRIPDRVETIEPARRPDPQAAGGVDEKRLDGVVDEAPGITGIMAIGSLGGPPEMPGR